MNQDRYPVLRAPVPNPELAKDILLLAAREGGQVYENLFREAFSQGAETGIQSSSKALALPATAERLQPGILRAEAPDGPVAGADWLAARKTIEHWLRTKPVNYADLETYAGTGAGEARQPIKPGSITGDDGRTYLTISRVLDPHRLQRELSAYAIHNESPFTNVLPASAFNSETGELVQERWGRSLQNLLTGAAARLGIQDRLLNNPAELASIIPANTGFADQLEQALVERGILGDSDSNLLGNLTVASARGKTYVGSIDWEYAYNRSRYEEIPKDIGHYGNDHFGLAGSAISSRTMTKIDRFVDTFKTQDGRSFLRHLQVEAEPLLNRGRWFLNNGRFSRFADFANE